jgi:hypothetical protein
MSYTNHLGTVNDALNDLIKTEFASIPVKNERKFKPDFRKGEFIRFWCVAQSEPELNSDGETREYTYDIDFYFNLSVLKRPKFEDLLAARTEQLKQLLQENVTYQPGGTYVWHNARIDLIEVEDFEDEEEEAYRNIVYVHCEFTLRRFNQWA